MSGCSRDVPTVPLGVAASAAQPPSRAPSYGEPLPEPAEVSEDPGDHLPHLREAIARCGIVFDAIDVPPGADGVSRGGRISIKPGLPAAQEFSVLVHELPDELPHRGESRPASKTVRETEAEALAFVLNGAIRLDTCSASADYIQLYDGKTETLVASLDRIQHAATEIISAVLVKAGQTEAA